MATVAASAMALLLWIATPDASATGAALMTAGIMQFIRLARCGRAHSFRPARPCPACRLCLRSRRFVLTGCAALGLISTTAGIHAWTEALSEP